MTSLRIAACVLAIITGVSGIAYAFFSGETGVTPLAVAVALIGAGAVVWRGGHIWILLVIWIIAAIWYLLPFGMLLYEYHQVGVAVPMNLQVFAWGMRFALSLLGLGLTVAAQQSRAGN